MKLATEDNPRLFLIVYFLLLGLTVIC